MPSRSADWRQQPRVTRDMIVDDLRRLGLAPGAIVLVHSSLSSLGHVAGGAEAVVDALCSAVAPGGTILFPTLTGSEADGPEHPPHVDVRHTACWTGRIPETARRHPDARRSLHPTHSIAALGAASADFSVGHELGASPCDEQSPYNRLLRSGGMILLLGVDQQSNTTLHCCEELAGVPYHLQPQPTAALVIDDAGREHTVTNYLHLWGWDRDFTKLDAPLAASGSLRTGRIGQAEARLIDARRMADDVLARLRQDPLFLLTTAARDAWIKRASATSSSGS
jgi:aminoglycoside 3-N-acetyltransferase